MDIIHLNVTNSSVSQPNQDVCVAKQQQHWNIKRHLKAVEHFLQLSAGIRRQQTAYKIITSFISVSQNLIWHPYQVWLLYSLKKAKSLFPIDVMFLHRVSFETSFDSKQPKLEPKLVSALSETKCLFRLFRLYRNRKSFDVSIEPK